VLALESLGRASMGQGALEYPSATPRSCRSSIRAACRARSARPSAPPSAVAGRTIGPVAAEASPPDRLALDEALTAHVPALAAMLPAIHAALVGAVADRRERSR
jgi:hypothetical protein